MKSVIAQGASVAKAIEEALKKAEQPQEFFVKVLEDAQPGFLGFGAKKAKIALFFKENVLLKKQDSLFERGAYESLFNNQAMKKQIEQQLKELGLEIKPIDGKPAGQDKPVQPRNPMTRMETRPLQNKPQVRPQQAPQQRSPQSTQVRDLSNKSQEDGGQGDRQRTDKPRQQFRRRRYYNNRSSDNNAQGSQQRQPRGSFGQDLNKFPKDEQ